MAAAMAGYLASAAWLYERPKAGKLLVAAVAAVSLWAAWLAAPSDAPLGALTEALRVVDAPSGGLVLGSTLAAMLLGHWYLNAPLMQLAPLKRLVLLMGASTALRGVVAGFGLALVVASGEPCTAWTWSLLALRWLAGIVGLGIVTFLTWQTLLVPNTQSATGTLYVGVILAFVGELCAQLLSGDLGFAV
jgi:hypothetical protein